MKTRKVIVYAYFVALLAIVPSSCKPKKKPAEGMVLVPAGEFTIGTNDQDDENSAEAFGIPKPWFEDERPERTIYLKEFAIDTFEVTNKRYKIFVDEAGYAAPPGWRNGLYPEGTANHPVTNVNFVDSVAYALWNGKSIPSEMQWEKAARGTDARLYPWGNTFDISRANVSKSMTMISEKKPVGSFPQGISPYGAHDMIGNIWEWTASWYDAYKGNEKKKEEYGKKFLVIRGQSYSYLGHFPDEMYSEVLSHMARASYRQEMSPDAKTPDLGFRCIAYPE